MSIHRVCVFCGSNHGLKAEYTDAAAELGRHLAQSGLGLVYGGGNVGLMGEVADAAMAAGGEVIGVIPESLVRWEVAHRGVTELRVVGSMHERKATMAELADGFIALPGGIGTLEELCEILTWAQLGLHRKPCVALNVLGFFDPLLALLDHAVAERFLRREHRALLRVAATPAEALDLLAQGPPPSTRKWMADGDS